jgi:hypothetical protein
MKCPPGVVKLERAVSFQEGALGSVSRTTEVANGTRDETPQDVAAFVAAQRGLLKNLFADDCHQTWHVAAFRS